MEEIQKSQKACFELLAFIFADAETLFHKIAPNGWKQSKYVQFKNPTAEQQFKRHKSFEENFKYLKKLRNKDVEEEKVEVKTLADFHQNNLDTINEREEFIYLFGLAVYDIFSNNHDVIDKNGETYSLGSMRGSGSFISNFINVSFDIGEEKYDYMDFYMGTTGYDDERIDLTQFYEFIFSKLKEKNCDWHYYFPRVGIVQFHKKETETPAAEYNPHDAILKEMEQKQKDLEVNKFKEKLDDIFENEFEEAKFKPLIPLVQAYKNVFGFLPVGHPQKEFE